MQVRPFRSLLAFSRAAAFLALTGVAATAFAAGEKDKAALKLHDAAMNDDYLAVEFGKATAKLKDAIKLCGASGCSPAVLAKLHASLATVYGVGQNKYDQAKEEFVLALKVDPTVAPDKGLTTPELTTAFNEAKAGAGGAEAPPTPTKRAPGGDLPHTPPPESGVNSPLPIYVDVPADLGAAKVTLRYKPFGGTAWKTIEMKKVGEGGYGVEIPCDDMTTTGEVKYYITISDDQNSPIAQAGTLKEPNRVVIKNEIEGEAPHLPGKPPPKQCAAKGDCPPGLAGCPDAKRGDKSEGAVCDTTTECQSGLSCLNGSCAADSGTPTGPTKGKRNVVGVYQQFDLTILKSVTPSATTPGVCDERNSSSYGCFQVVNGTPTNHQLFGAPDDAVPDKDAISGGFAFAGVRTLVGYDRQLLATVPLTIGLRFGVAYGSSMPTPDNVPVSPEQAQLRWAPAKSFPPIHAEGRVGYSFGGSIFEGGHFHPFAFVGFGVGRVTASVPVNICDQLDPNTGRQIMQPNSQCKVGNKPRNDHSTPAEVYQIEGLNFVAAGFGSTYGITDNFGISAELKIMTMLPTFGIVFSPTLGPVFAF